MDVYAYLSKVLGHIRHTSDRTPVMHELTDHWEEMKKWYIDIGYDADAADERVTEDMGDAHVTGEQLAARSKRRFPVCFVLAVLLFAASCVSCGNIDGDGWIVWDAYKSGAIYLLLALLLLIISSARQRIGATLVSSLKLSM